MSDRSYIRPRALRRLATWVVVLAVGGAVSTGSAQMAPPMHLPQLSSPLAPVPDASSGGLVARWILVTDRMGRGMAYPQVQAAVAMAMHDALNAVEPHYRRWRPAEGEEPAGEGASAEVALAVAAFRVLASVFPVPLLREDMTMQRRRRLLLALRALDGRIEAASYRDLAAGLFGAARVPVGAAWKTHDLRSRTMRLFADAVRLRDGGYRALLRLGPRVKLAR